MTKEDISHLMQCWGAKIQNSAVFLVYSRNFFLYFRNFSCKSKGFYKESGSTIRMGVEYTFFL